MEAGNVEPRKAATQFNFRCVFRQHTWLRVDRDFWRCKYCGKLKTNVKK
jgi:hypothetical protein